MERYRNVCKYTGLGQYMNRIDRFVLHNPTLPEELRKGPEGTKKYASAVIAAVPNRKLVHHDVFAKGDKVLIRWTNSGTNT
jgi:hypothetical protein